MASTTIAWGDAVGGNIVLTGVGTSQLSVQSDTMNIGADRSKIISLVTTNSGSVHATASVTVTQTGLSEVLYATDGALSDSAGSYLITLRQKYLFASDGIIFDNNKELIITN